MNAREKTTILKFYRKNIQRHIYHRGADRLFLSKNAAFCTWLPDLKAHFPSAKFILSVRKPETAIPSQLKALNSARKIFGTDPKGILTQSIILDAFKKNYRALVNFLGHTPKQTTTDFKKHCDWTQKVSSSKPSKFGFEHRLSR